MTDKLEKILTEMEARERAATDIDMSELEKDPCIKSFTDQLFGFEDALFFAHARIDLPRCVAALRWSFCSSATRWSI